MKVGITLFLLQLTLTEFTDVLSLPSRRDRQRIAAPQTGIENTGVTASGDPLVTTRPSAGRVRKQHKQMPLTPEQQRIKNGRSTTESSSRDMSCNDECDVQLCPAVNGTCHPAAAVVSDPCQCCVCHSPGPITRPVTATAAAATRLTVVNACEQLSCPRNKVCLLNIQGLPMCRCLSVYHCKGADKRPVCTEGNRTFNNKCLVRVEECSTNRRLRIIHKGPCQASPTRGPASIAHAGHTGRPAWRQRNFS